MDTIGSCIRYTLCQEDLPKRVSLERDGRVIFNSDNKTITTLGHWEKAQAYDTVNIYIYDEYLGYWDFIVRHISYS